MTEKVRRVVLVLQRHEPLVIYPKGGLDALRSLVGLQADLVDVVAARGEGTHHLRQLARPWDVYGVRTPHGPPRVEELHRSGSPPPGPRARVVIHHASPRAA